MALIGQVVSEEKIFEIVDGRRTDGRTADHGHPISSPCEPNGSGELKMYRIYRKIPDSFQEDFDFLVKKLYILEEFLPILQLISWSLPDDEGCITCIHSTTCT